MADLFTVRFNVGLEAPVAVVSTAVFDLSVIADAAMNTASVSAQVDGRRYLSDLVANEGPRALVLQLRRLELSGSESFERNVELLEQFAEEFDLFAREFGPPFFPSRTSRRGRYAAIATALFGSSWAGSPWGESPWQPVIQQLVAAETAARLPRRGFRLRSLTYSNPVVGEVIAEAGAASVALAYLLRTIATLGPRHRRESARADAEQRIQAANARDAEDLVDRRTELRRILLSEISRGTIPLRPEDITDALLGKIVGAADRLADRDLAFDRQELPTT